MKVVCLTLASLALSAKGHGRNPSHTSKVICQQPSTTGDAPLLVRISKDNYRELSFVGGDGTQSAVQCQGEVPTGCGLAHAHSPPPLLLQTNLRSSHARHARYARDALYASAPLCALVHDCPCTPLGTSGSKEDVGEMEQEMLPFRGMQLLAEPVLGPCLKEALPLKVLAVGLGGGALQTFLHSQCGTNGQGAVPDITTYELDQRVASVAASLFGFNNDGEQSVHVGDGAAAVAALASTSARFDFVLVDCFAANDRVPSACRSEEFYSSIKQLLRQPTHPSQDMGVRARQSGQLVQNLWAHSSHHPEVAVDFKEAQEALASVFHGAIALKESYESQEAGERVVQAFA